MVDNQTELQALYQLLYSIRPIDNRQDILLAVDKALMILDYIMGEMHANN